jgi:hypothetical protein
MKSSRTGAGFGSLVEDGLLPGDEPESAVRVVVDSFRDLAQRRGDSIQLSERLAYAKHRPTWLATQMVSSESN